LNQPEELRRCLESLRDQSFGRPFEIVVIDNGSKVIPADVCAAFDRVRLGHEQVPGPGPARNKGVSLSEAPILAFVDADCIADRGWLSSIAAAFADPAVEVVGGDVRIAIRDLGRPTMLESYESIYAYRQASYIEKQGFSGTGNLAMRRATFMRVGHFGGIGVAEDRDWGRRARAKGVTIRYAPTMRVYHPARLRFDELRLKWDRQISHDFADLPGGIRGRAVWSLKAAALIASPLMELPTILSSDRVRGVRQRIDAATILTKVRLYRTRRMLSVLFSDRRAQAAQSWNRT
jgi:glycosyltransferase involved in cell wall biosynthesis